MSVFSSDVEKIIQITGLNYWQTEKMFSLALSWFGTNGNLDAIKALVPLVEAARELERQDHFAHFKY